LRSASLAFGPSDDPCADKQSHWRPKKAVLLFLLLALLYLLNGRGRLHEWDVRDRRNEAGRDGHGSGRRSAAPENFAAKVMPSEPTV
jgi:hypothetical protein